MQLEYNHCFCVLHLDSSTAAGRIHCFHDSDTEMTTDSAHKHSESATTSSKIGCSCHLQFGNGDVRVIIEQSPDADETDHMHHPSGSKQRLISTAARPRKRLKCVTRTRVVLERPVLEQLPLLLDICDSTTGADRSKSINLELPYSVWGFSSSF